MSTRLTIQNGAIVSGSLDVSGSISFGDGSQIQSISASSGDGYGFTTLELKPDVGLASDQYIVLDPTSPGHIHIRAGGAIDSSSAYLYLGGEKANVVVRNLDNSFNEKYWVQINSQTGSTQNTWIFDADGKLTMPGSLEQGNGVIATGSYSHAEGNITQAIGDFSHAEGDNTQAVGNYSHAEGQETISSGSYSHAEGYLGQTIGDYSHAEGYQTQAIGLYSHAEGAESQAIGQYSHAEGDSTDAIGNSSHAEGSSTRAIGNYSHAEGDGTRTGTQNAYYVESVASGIVTLSGSYGDISSQFGADNRLHLYDLPFDDYYGRATFIISQSYFDSTNTIVELYDTSVNTTTAYAGNISINIFDWTGDQTIPGDYAHTEGSITVALGLYSHAEGHFSKAIGRRSHAEGEETQTIGEGAHAEGQQTQAIGAYSHAEGNQTQAAGLASHAEGQQTTASGSYSHAEGVGTQAAGLASHAEGQQTQAIGEGSHAEGYLTTARGYNSHAEGYQTVASGSYQHISGQYNQHNNDTSYFVVGIGLSEETRKDGFTVDVDDNGSGSVMIPHNLDAPSVAKTGSMYVDPANNKLWIYTGNGGVSGWVTASLG